MGDHEHPYTAQFRKSWENSGGKAHPRGICQQRAMPGWVSLPAQFGGVEPAPAREEEGGRCWDGNPPKYLSPPKIPQPRQEKTCPAPLFLRTGLEVTLGAATLPSRAAGLGCPKPGLARSWLMPSVGRARTDQVWGFLLGAGLGRAGFMAGLDDLGGFFQPKEFYDCRCQSPWGRAWPLLALLLTWARESLASASPDQRSHGDKTQNTLIYCNMEQLCLAFKLKYKVKVKIKRRERKRGVKEHF